MTDKRAPPAEPRAAAEILRKIDEQPVQIDGATMSKREAQLRIVYARALNGDSKASQQLQRVRDRAGLEELSQKVGCLLVPEPVSLEEYERETYEQQRPFREKQYGSSET